MIVISGALVLVALVLLVIGLISPDLAFVYASIGVSLASFAFLVVGILQRRKEDVSGETTSGVAGSGAVKAGLGAVVRAGDKALGRDATDSSEGVTTLPPVYKAPAGAAEPMVGNVLVVAGRPRYHVEGCRYLTGKDPDSVAVADAREEGFTACGVCKPDENLAAPAAEVQSANDEPGEPETIEQAPVAAARVSRPSSRATATVSKAVAPTSKAAAKKPPAKAAAVPAKAAAAAKETAPAKAAPPKAVAAKAASSKAGPAKAAPAKAAKPAPTKASPAKKAAAAPVKRGGVIVIPDRGKYHSADCRYVRGAEDTLELTKAQAVRQGYDACGVCNP